MRTYILNILKISIDALNRVMYSTLFLLHNCIKKDQSCSSALVPVPVELVFFY